MSTPTNKLICACAALLTSVVLCPAQQFRIAAADPVKASVPVTGATNAGTQATQQTTQTTHAAQTAQGTQAAEEAHSTSAPTPMTLVQAAPAAPQPVAATTAASPAANTAANSVIESGGVGVREFQGDDVGQVLRLLARQAKINMVVSEAVAGTVTMRLEDVTAMQAIAIIVKAKSLFMDQMDNVYYIKTATERTAEPTESDSYQFSYARAKDVAPHPVVVRELDAAVHLEDRQAAVRSRQHVDSDERRADGAGGREREPDRRRRRVDGEPRRSEGDVRPPLPFRGGATDAADDLAPGDDEPEVAPGRRDSSCTSAPCCRNHGSSSACRARRPVSPARSGP